MKKVGGSSRYKMNLSYEKSKRVTRMLLHMEATFLEIGGIHYKRKNVLTKTLPVIKRPSPT